MYNITYKNIIFGCKMHTQRRRFQALVKRQQIATQTHTTAIDYANSLLPIVSHFQAISDFFGIFLYANFIFRYQSFFHYLYGIRIFELHAYRKLLGFSPYRKIVLFSVRRVKSAWKCSRNVPASGRRSETSHGLSVLSIEFEIKAKCMFNTIPSYACHFGWHICDCGGCCHCCCQRCG